MFHAIAREVFEYQAKHGGKSPEQILVPKSVMDVLEKEAVNLSYRMKDSVNGISTICGVKVFVDNSLRVARMVP